jgi:hypothetical protein
MWPCGAAGNTVDLRNATRNRVDQGNRGGALVVNGNNPSSQFLDMYFTGMQFTNNTASTLPTPVTTGTLYPAFLEYQPTRDVHLLQLHTYSWVRRMAGCCCCGFIVLSLACLLPYVPACLYVTCTRTDWVQLAWFACCISQSRRSWEPPKSMGVMVGSIRTYC